MIDVLVTMRFNGGQLARLSAVSPEVAVRREDAATADYSRADILYAGSLPRDLDQAPNLKWVQLHLAGVDALDNIIVSPHVSGFVASYDDRCSELFAENLRRYLEGAPLLNLVDRAKGY